MITPEVEFVELLKTNKIMDRKLDDKTVAEVIAFLLASGIVAALYTFACGAGFIK